MKHRLLAAIFCVCLALTSLCAPALADDAEAETPVPAAETPVPAEETPAPVPVVYGERSNLKINDEYIELNTYYKVDSSAAVGYSKAAEGEDYNFIYDGGTLVLKDTVLGYGSDANQRAVHPPVYLFSVDHDRADRRKPVHRAGHKLFSDQRGERYHPGRRLAYARRGDHGDHQTDDEERHVRYRFSPTGDFFPKRGKIRML